MTTSAKFELRNVPRCLRFSSSAGIWVRRWIACSNVMRRSSRTYFPNSRAKLPSVTPPFGSLNMRARNEPLRFIFSGVSAGPLTPGRSFAPVARAVSALNVLVVHPSLPVNTLQEFLAYAKAHPDQLSYASQGNGSTAHLTAELFKLKTGAPGEFVQYKSMSETITALSVKILLSSRV